MSLFSPGPSLLEKASDPTTPSRELERLWEQPVPASVKAGLAQALALNPNLPLERMARQLMPLAPREFLKNPSLQIYALSELQSKLWGKLLSSQSLKGSDVPDWLLDWYLARGQSLEWIQLARLAELTPRILEALLASSSGSVRLGLALRRELPEYVAHQLAQDPDPRVREAVLRKHPLSTDLLKALSRDPHPRVRVQALEKQPPTQGQLQAVLKDFAPEVRVYIARTPKLKESQLLAQARTGSWDELRALARRKSLPESVRSLLWKASRSDVVQALLDARHPMPGFVLDRLPELSFMKQSYGLWRRDTLSHPGITTRFASFQLDQEPNWRIVAALARAPSLSWYDRARIACSARQSHRSALQQAQRLGEPFVFLRQEQQ